MFQRLHTSSHGEMVKYSGGMVKWCNKKHLHIIMVKWCNEYVAIVQIIHTSLHGEMVKHSSGDIIFKNGEMVKW